MRDEFLTGWACIDVVRLPRLQRRQQVNRPICRPLLVGRLDLLVARLASRALILRFSPSNVCLVRRSS
jgi:hypothetical protein